MKNVIAQSKAWVYTTAFIMSFNGGYVNSISLFSILKSPVGYMTGNLTMAGGFFGSGQFYLFFHLASLVISFFLGAMLSGLVIQGQNFKIDRRYSASLSLQFTTLTVAMILLVYHHEQASYFLALTMGMQNAMTTHYGTALIRTTHMTGTTTDFGILVAHWLKGHHVDFWKMSLYGCLIFGFSCGAIFGAVGYHFEGPYALLLSLLFYVIMMSWRFMHKKYELSELYE